MFCCRLSFIMSLSTQTKTFLLMSKVGGREAVPTIPRFFSRERRSNQNRPRVEVLRIQTITPYPCFFVFFFFIR